MNPSSEGGPGEGGVHPGSLRVGQARGSAPELSEREIKKFTRYVALCCSLVFHGGPLVARAFAPTPLKTETLGSQTDVG